MVAFCELLLITNVVPLLLGTFAETCSLNLPQKGSNIFYRLALIEAYGTGIPKTLNSYKGFAVQPKFEATDHAFKITLPNQNALKETIVTISEEEQQIIEMAQKQGKLKRKDVEEELKISQTLSGRLLRNLVHEGTLQVMGKGKNTYYVIK